MKSTPGKKKKKKTSYNFNHIILCDLHILRLKVITSYHIDTEDYKLHVYLKNIFTNKNLSLNRRHKIHTVDI